MPDLDDIKANPENAFWDVLDDARAVMLGADGGGKHMQPMAPQVDKETKTIWFYTNRQTDLAQAVALPTPSMLCLQDEDEFFACATGTIQTVIDQKIIDRFWSPVIAAWFPEGKADPDLTLLAFFPQDISIWASDDSVIRFGYEVTKANITGEAPEIGHHSVVNIRR